MIFLREFDYEARTSGRSILDPRAPAMESYELAHDGKPDATPTRC